MGGEDQPHLSFFSPLPSSIEFIFYFIIVTIGYLLGIYVTYKKVLITHGPNSNKIKEIKYNHNGKCYMFKPKIRKC